MGKKKDKKKKKKEKKLKEEQKLLAAAEHLLLPVRLHLPKARRRSARKSSRRRWKSCRSSWSSCRNGSNTPAPRSACCSKAAIPPARAASSSASPSGSARASSRWSPSARPPTREKSQMYFQRYMPYLPGRRGSGFVRPLLVQPGRGGAGDGLCHPRAGGPLPEIRTGSGTVDRPFRDAS